MTADKAAASRKDQTKAAACLPESDNHTLAERLIKIKTLEETYLPKKRIRKTDRILICKILSLRKGYNGKVAKCEIHNPKFGENKITSIDLLEIHHLDENPSNNELDNLTFAHHVCNSSDYGRRRASHLSQRLTLPESAPIPTTIDEIGSKELAKHNVQRRLWNLFINDKKKGAFSKVKQWYITALAEAAVHALGMGSSITYRRFIREDVRGNVLEKDTDDKGRAFVTYKGQPSIWRYLPANSTRSEDLEDSVYSALDKLEKDEKKDQDQKKE